MVLWRKIFQLIEDCVILCGGQGTRLGKLTISDPKPMLLINGVPLLDLVIQNVSRYGIKNFYLLAGYHGSKIKNHYLKYNFQNLNIKVIIEEERLGTGGAVKNFILQNNLKKFVILNGDTYIETDYFSIFNAKHSKFPVEICGIKVNENVERYGSIVANKNNDECLNFQEKTHHSSEKLISSGIVIFHNPDLLLNFQAPFSLENSFFPDLLKNRKLGLKLISQDYFVDIGIPDSFSKALKEIPLLKKKAVFFDRDNTLNFDMGYTYKPKDLEIVPVIKTFLNYAIASKYLPIVISNQSGVGRGFYLEEDVWEFHEAMQLEFFAENLYLSALYFCPHLPDSQNNPQCQCRKPNIQLLLHASSDWNIDLSKSIFIGDSRSDQVAAQTAGLKNFFNPDQTFLKDFQQCL